MMSIFSAMVYVSPEGTKRLQEESGAFLAVEWEPETPIDPVDAAVQQKDIQSPAVLDLQPAHSLQAGPSFQFSHKLPECMLVISIYSEKVSMGAVKLTCGSKNGKTPFQPCCNQTQ
jgi:hypothetical protein